MTSLASGSNGSMAPPPPESATAPAPKTPPRNNGSKKRVTIAAPSTPPPEATPTSPRTPVTPSTPEEDEASVAPTATDFLELARTKSTLKSAKVWDVISPPPVNSVKGHFVPGMLKSYHRERRISVEVHKIVPIVPPAQPSGSLASVVSGLIGSQKDLSAEGNSTSVGGSNNPRGLAPNEKLAYEQVYVRILIPASSKEAKAARVAASKAKRKAKKMANNISGQMLKFKRDETSAHRRDDDTVSLLGQGGVDDAVNGTSTGNGQIDYFDEDLDDGSLAQVPRTTEWIQKYKILLKDVTLNKRLQNVCVLTTVVRKVHQTREIIFPTEKEATAFASLLKQQKGMERKRSERKLESALGGLKLKLSEPLDLLVEVVSAQGLPPSDLFGADPYVVVSFGDEEVHQTKHISRTLDPVWTLTTGSLFLLSVKARELFESDGLMFVVKDYDQVGTDEVLGAVSVPPKALYESNGERVEYTLHSFPTQSRKLLSMKKNAVKEHTVTAQGVLAIRCRHATHNDKEFMKKFHSEAKAKIDQSAAHDVAGGRGNISSIIHSNTRFEKTPGPNEGKKLYKVRPSPDPKREAATEWLTKEEIMEETMNPSHHWLDVGSGNLARIYVEVLGCDDLPNLDAGGLLGNKTDAFVNMVYEDCIVRTDVIDDCLSPRWMPWSKRAFILHAMHTSSPLFLGVFDYDRGTVDDHDLIGRVSVDLTSLRPDTVYMLNYDIFPTAKLSERKSQGKVSIRLRIEIPDQQKLVLSNLEPPPTVYVNVKKKKDFRTARYTCSGKYDTNQYSYRVINAYIEELIAYKYMMFFIEDAVISVIMWRFEFTATVLVPRIPGLTAARHSAHEGTTNFLAKYMTRVSFKMPLHSILAFLSGVFLVERPGLIPSFFFFSVGWILLAVMGFRYNDPNPWNRCKSFGEIVEVLLLGKPSLPHSIAPGENEEEAKKYMEKWVARVEAAEEAAAKEEQRRLEEQAQLEREMEEIGETNVDLSTSTSRMPSVDPLKRYLFPLQQYLGMACDALRFAKNVTIWEESYFAFWLTAGCLALSVGCLFVPWAFLMRWTLRIVVWVVLGPWMKLVDIYYYSKIKPLTEEEQKAAEEEEKKKREEATAQAAMEARIKREDATKLKEMKVYLFGKFITHVPVLKLDRYRDTPLASSSATPYVPERLSLSALAMKEAGSDRTRVPGQHLVGNMIPTLADEELLTEVPPGSAIGHPNMLDGPLEEEDSNVAIVAKTSSVVVVAAALTWFGVPLLISAVRWVMQQSVAMSSGAEDGVPGEVEMVGDA